MEERSLTLVPNTGDASEGVETESKALAKRPRAFARRSRLPDSRHTVAVGFYGGGAQSICHDVMRRLDSDKFTFKVFNTDKRTLEVHFDISEKSNEHVKMWEKKGKFSFYQLGGMTVTNGLGAGLMEEVGKKAASTPQSMRAILKHYQHADIPMHAVCEGGGTGTLSAVVAAKAWQDRQRTNPTPTRKARKQLALAIMPDQELLGNWQRAKKGLGELQDLAATFVLYNNLLDEHLENSGMPKVDRDALTLDQRYKEFNKIIIDPLFERLDATVNNTTLVAHNDLANWDTLYSCGNYPFLGFYELTVEQALVITPEELVLGLCEARCQKIMILEAAEKVMFCLQGPLPNKVYTDSIKLLRKFVGTKSKRFKASPEDGIEFVPGVDNRQSTNGKVIVWLWAVAESLPEISTITSELKKLSEPIKQKAERIKREKEAAEAALARKNGAEETKAPKKGVIISCTLKGQVCQILGVTRGLQETVDRVWRDPTLDPANEETIAQVKRLRKEVHDTSKPQIWPDPPAQIPLEKVTWEEEKVPAQPETPVGKAPTANQEGWFTRWKSRKEQTAGALE